MIWEWNQQQEAWLCGTPNNGAGVFLDKDKWHGNVAHPLQCFMMGPYDDRDTAQRECLADLNRLRELNGESPLS